MCITNQQGKIQGGFPWEGGGGKYNDTDYGHGLHVQGGSGDIPTKENFGN